MEYKVVGLMSGTSCDGLDVALCLFAEKNRVWSYEILKAETIPFTNDIRQVIDKAITYGGEHLAYCNFAFGKWCGEMVENICRRASFNPILVASHGHTIYHNPAKGYTYQAGNGEALAISCGFPVVYDFRSADVALGGQGAPLVPVGDRHLFEEYDYCLNVGGIANISLMKDGKQVAYDIAAANMVMNHLAQKMGLPYDDGGRIASSGSLIDELLNTLDDLSYYKSAPPKSLGREWVEKEILPLFTDQYPLPDQLHTYVIHLASTIASEINGGKSCNTIITGGGAFNRFFIEELRKRTECSIFTPDDTVVNYKEALIFGFLGLLRWLGRINVYKTVTGAKKDHCAGSIALP